jgi:hypothetical protein
MARTQSPIAEDGAWSPGVSSHVGMIVGVLQSIYGVGVLLLSLAAALLLVIAGPSRYPPGAWACAGLGLAAMAVTYFGPRLRKSWVVPLIVAWSAYAVVPSLRDSETVVATVTLRAVALVSLFQLWLFTRAETRRYFRVSGMTVF